MCLQFCTNVTLFIIGRVVSVLIMNVSPVCVYILYFWAGSVGGRRGECQWSLLSANTCYTQVGLHKDWVVQ